MAFVEFTLDWFYVLCHIAPPLPPLSLSKPNQTLCRTGFSHLDGRLAFRTSRIAFHFAFWSRSHVKKTIIAVTTATAMLAAFVCLPNVHGQNGPAARANSSPKSAPQSSPALKIACIDFETILKEYKKVADKLQERNAIAEAGNAKIRQMQGEGQAVVKLLQDGKIDQDSDEFRAREKKAFQLENSIKACKATTERDIKLQTVKISVAVYADLQAALKLFSEQNGYTLVLQIDREAAHAEDYRLTQKALGQPIFYYRSHEDITVRVLSYLNRRYEAERKEAGLDESAAPVSPADQPTRTIPVSPNRKPATR